jgi:hypothetical protein
MIRYADIGAPYHESEDYPDYVEAPADALCPHAKYCKAQLMELGNVDAVLKHGCILTGDGLDAESCWQLERRRRMAVARLHACYARFNDMNRQEAMA